MKQTSKTIRAFYRVFTVKYCKSYRAYTGKTRADGEEREYQC